MHQEQQPPRPAPDYLDLEFDQTRRILHIGFKSRIHPTTKEQLDRKFAVLGEILGPYTKSGRVYLIINMSNVIFEPELKTAYVANAQAIQDKYIMPDGIARYGFQITRITVRQGYAEQSGEDPHIFNSREEAFAYIEALIERHQSAGIPPTAVTMQAGSAARLFPR